MKEYGKSLQKTEMNNFLWFLVTRVLIATASAGLFSFLAQVAVFRYTRSVQSPIPAQGIFGLPDEGFKLLVAVLWFFIVIFVSLFWFLGRMSIDRGVSTEEKGKEYFKEHVCSILGLLSLFKWSCISSFLIALLFIIFPSVTERALRYMGHGGGVAVCYEPNNQLADYTRDVKLALETTLSNNIRAQLIYLSGDKAYVRLLPPGDSLAVATNTVGSKTIPGLYIVQREDYLTAGYHIVEASSISGGC